MRELLYTITKDDFKIEYFSGTGKGGQHRNKHQNCVRLIHKDSGITVVCQNHRKRTANLKEAFITLSKLPKFKVWLYRKCQEIIDGKTIEEKVDEMLKDENLKIEVKDKDEWIDYYDEDNNKVSKG